MLDTVHESKFLNTRKVCRTIGKLETKWAQQLPILQKFVNDGGIIIRKIRHLKKRIRWERLQWDLIQDEASRLG